jgi:hypothetical protein
MTILALIVAPACAPLCAAQTCAQAPVSAGMGSHCHSREVANGSAVHLHSVEGCGAPELQVANLPSLNKRGSFQRDQSTVSASGLDVRSAEHPYSRACHRARCDAGLGSPPHSCSAISTVVLRI